MRKLVLLFCLLVGFSAAAQRIVVRKGGSATESARIKGKSSATNLKFGVGSDIGSFLIGYFPVEVEYLAGDWVTLEVGAGLTTKNYVKGLILEGYDGEDPGVGFGLSGKVRFFFDNDAWDDGWYLGLMFRSLSYNSKTTVSGWDEMSFESVTFPGVGMTRRFTEVGLINGRQYLPNDRVVLDAYYGFSFISNTYEVESVTPPSGVQMNPYNPEDELPVSLVWGIKVSFLAF